MSAAGMRARTDGKLMQGAAVKVHFTPDGGAPIEVIGLVARLEADGVGLSFVHLPDGDAQRLRDLVARTKAYQRGRKDLDSVSPGVLMLLRFPPFNRGRGAPPTAATKLWQGVLFTGVEVVLRISGRRSRPL